MGGLARRATVIKNIKNNNLLLFDGGNIFSSSSGDYIERCLKTDLTINAMNSMGYQCVSIGALEFSLGLDFLQNAVKKASFKFVCSNIQFKNKNISEIKDHILLNIGGKKIALLSILYFNTINKIIDEKTKKEIKILPPNDSIKNILKKINLKTDLIILLSQLNFEETKKIMKNNNRIDMAILFDKEKHSCEYDKDVKIQNSIRPIFLNCENSDLLRYINISLNDRKKITINKQDEIKLDEKIFNDEKIDKIVMQYSDDSMKYLRKLKEQEKDLQHKKLMEGLKQTPEEFMKSMGLNN